MAATRGGAVCPGCGRPKAELSRPHRCPGQPYLGPIPAPSHPYGLALMAGAPVFAVLALVRAVLYWQRAGLDQQLADGQAVHQDIVTNAGLLLVLSVLTLGGVVGFVVVEVVWRRRRRPADVLRQWGEACVESPLRVTLPAWLRGASIALAVAWAWSFVLSSTNSTMTLSQLVSARRWSTVSYVVLAGLWLLVIPLVRTSEAHLAARIATSGAARQQPASVGYLAPVQEGIGRSEGPWWIFTTLGLAMLVIVGLICLIAGVTGLASGQPMAATVTLAIALVCLGFVIWRLRRRADRRRRRRASPPAAPIAPSQAETRWYQPTEPPPPTPAYGQLPPAPPPAPPSWAPAPQPRPDWGPPSGQPVGWPSTPGSGEGDRR